MIALATPNGTAGYAITARVASDPRLSRAQLDALQKAVDVDPRAAIEGLDAKMRPVIRARLGIPQTPRCYALLRNGDPTTVTRPLAEVWRG